MRICFVMLDLRYTKYYYETLRSLLRDGHTIHVGYFNLKEPPRETLHQHLRAEFSESFSLGQAPRKRSDMWNDLSTALSWGMDYLLYLGPRFENARRLRERVEARMHPAYVWLTTKCPVVKTAGGLALVNRLLKAAYDSIGSDPAIREYIQDFRPDVLLVSPLVVHGTLQSEYLKAARELGVASALCVASWDNLTTKGVIRGNPDRVIVWNETQEQEAVTLHGMAPQQLVVTGAQYFDEWFKRRPSRSREEFCKVVGLPAGRPILLYLCSSSFMAPNEPPFVLRWIMALRRSGIPQLAEAGILIRPYPEYVDKWKTVDFSSCGNVVVWPPDGEYTYTDMGKLNFYDSIYHSFAVVGINTTAMIESVIIGKCVLTIMAPELNESQENTLHFHYLRQERGGFLYVAQNLDEHVQQLREILDGGDRLYTKVRAFVKNFARPHGMEIDCIPILVRTILNLPAAVSAHTRPVASHLLARLVLYPVALFLSIYTLLHRGEAKRRKSERKRLVCEANIRGDDPLEYIRAAKGGEKSGH